MARIALQRDPSGKLILPGNGRPKIRREDFLVGNLTSHPWLTAAQGTASFQNMVAGRGQITIATSGSTGSQAQLRTGQMIDLAGVEYVKWTVEGWTVDANAGINLYMGISDSGKGAYAAATPDPGIKAVSGDTAVVIPDNWLSDGEWQRRKTRSFLVVCGTKHAYVLESEQVVADVDLSASMVLGPAYPSISITQATGTTARNLVIGAVELEVGWY